MFVFFSVNYAEMYLTDNNRSVYENNRRSHTEQSSKALGQIVAPTRFRFCCDSLRRLLQESALEEPRMVSMGEIGLRTDLAQTQ